MDKILCIVIILYGGTVVISGLIAIITSIYGLSKEKGKITERCIPLELVPCTTESQVWSVVPIINIFKCLRVLIKTIKYYKRR